MKNTTALHAENETVTHALVLAKQPSLDIIDCHVPQFRALSQSLSSKLQWIAMYDKRLWIVLSQPPRKIFIIVYALTYTLPSAPIRLPYSDLPL